MGLFVISIYLLGITLFPAWLLKKRFEEVFPLALMAGVLLLFAFGLLGMLGEGVYILLSWAVGSSLFVIWKNRKGLRGLARLILTPGLLVFAIGFGFMLVLYDGDKLLYEWDELAYWGPLAKATYVFNALPAGSLFAGEIAATPPAATLFQYQWMKLTGYFSEQQLLLSLHVLCFSMLLPAIKGLEWKDFPLWIPAGLLAFALPSVALPEYLNNIYPDALLALTFAYLMSQIFLLDKDNHFAYINISIACSFLLLVKGSGLALAIIAIIALAVRVLRMDKVRISFSYSRQRNNRPLYAIGVALCIALPAICYGAWALATSSMPGHTGWESSLRLGGLLAMLTGQAPQYRYDVASSFFRRMLGYTNSDAKVLFSYAGWLMVLFAITAALVWLHRKKRKPGAPHWVNICMLAGGVAYAFAVLMLYLFGTDEAYAANLPSYFIYMNTYTLAYLGFAFLNIAGMLGSALPRKQPFRAMAYAPSFASITLVLFMLLPGNFKATLAMADTDCAGRRASRECLQRDAAILQQHVDINNDKVFLVAQNTYGYEYYTLRFEMLPMRTNAPYNWSIGDPYPPSSNGISENWTWAISPDQFLAHLQDGGYGYVYLVNVDEQFANQFGHLFGSKGHSVADRSLYRVEQTSGQPTLSFIQ